jgi:hypothetical protein
MRPWWIFLLCATASAAADPAEVLHRVLLKLRESLKVIPNYTCVETVTRDFYIPIAPLRRDCAVMLEMKKHPTLDMQLRHAWTDRLRLEVALTKQGEILSWAGASRFDDRPIDELIREGPIGTGVFAALLASIFDQDVMTFRFERRVTVNGEDRLEFSFDVPQSRSHYRVKTGNEWVYSGYRGIFHIDPVREEVTDLRMETAILPEAAFTCQSRTQVEFTMTAIGGGVFPMASRARQQFIASDGNEAINLTHFSDCREYVGESTIRFGDDSAPAAATKGAPSSRPDPVVPRNLDFSIELTAPIDTATAAAGDRFIGRLRSALRTLAPAGSRVEGRILRVQVTHHPPESALVVLRPESVEVRGVRVPLAATRDLRKEIAANRGKPTRILLPFAHELNAGLYEIPKGKSVLPKGFVSDWRTVSPR